MSSNLYNLQTKSRPNILDTGIGAVAKYNPHLWGPEELKAIFVVRQKELKQLIATLEQTDADTVPQHQLLIGQRGMGKTTLLQRIALYVDESKSLSENWLALRFPEEQYTVSNLAELWGNVLGALADALEAKGQDTFVLDQQLMQLEQLPADERESQSLDIINHWCEQQNKRLLLLIDSTDLLFDNLNDRKKTDPNGIAVNLWRLRKTLQHNKNLFWLGGSYQALEANDLYHDAFQDFFQLTELKPLTLDEVHQAMRAMARTFNSHNQSPDVAEQQIVSTLEQRPERLKTLRLLTGGNPRTTVMLFELFSTSGEAQVRSDLERLLDMMTPLYKARLEALPDQQRKVIAHIMEAWQPIGLGPLSKTANMPNTKVSPLLNRMEKEGLIVKAELPNTTKAGYQTAERFFNIWYLMRNAPRRLKLRLAWLVEFMRMWYTPVELEHIAHSRMHRHHKGNNQIEDLEYSRAVASALPLDSHSRHQLDYQLYQQLQQQREKLQEFFDFEGEDQPIKSIDDYCQRFKALKINLAKRLKDIDAFNGKKQQQEEFAYLVITAIDLTIQQKEQFLEQNLTDKKLAEIKKELQQTAKSWQQRAGKKAFEAFCKSVDELDFYLDLPDITFANIQLQTFIEHSHIYWHFVNKIWQKIEQAGSANPKNELAVKELAVKETAQHHIIESLIINGLQHPSNSVEQDNWHLFEGLLKNTNTNQKVVKAVENWVTAGLKCDNENILLNLGYLLQETTAYCNLHSHISQLTEKIYLQAIKVNPQFAYPWNDLGNLYQDQLKQFDKAEQAYKQAIKLNSNFALPWNNLGYLYQYQLKQLDKAEQAYKQAIKLNSNFALPWNNLGNLYKNQLKQFDKAEQAYKQAIKIDSNYAYPWYNLGNLYQYQLKQFDKAEQAYKQAIKLNSNYAFPWHNLGNLYQYQLKQLDKAEQAYKQAINIDSNYADPWNGLANLYQDHFKQFDTAEQAYIKALAIDESEPFTHYNLARLYVVKQQFEQANQCYHKALALQDAESTEAFLLLQAYLWLNNLHDANNALSELAQLASNDNWYFFRIKEQCWECQQIGKGMALAQLMAQNPHSEFLKPFELALREVNGDVESKKASPAEMQQMVDEIVAEIKLLL